MAFETLKMINAVRQGEKLVESLRRELETAKGDITKEVKLQEDLAKEIGRTASVQAQLDAAVQNGAALQTQLDAAVKNGTALQTQLDAAVQSGASLQKQLDDERARGGDLLKQLGDLTAKTNAVVEQLTAAEALDDELDSVKAEFEKAKTEFAAERATHKSLLAQADFASAAALRARSGQVENMRKELDEERAKSERLRAEIDDANEKLSQSAIDVRKWKAIADNKGASLATQSEQKDEIHKLKTELGVTTKQLNDSMTRRAACERQMAELELQIDALQRELEAARPGGV